MATGSEFLDPTELQQLTDYSRAKEQSAWLKERGIPHRQEGSRVIVSRVHVRQWLEGRELVIGDGINWGAMGA